MNIKTAIVLTMALSTSAIAGDDYAKKVEYCKGISGLAGSIARAHQTGVTLDDVLSLKAGEDLERITISIYRNNKRHQHETDRDREVRNTKNAYMLSRLDN